ncbi:MAG: transketolase [Thermoplasmata archaeon]|nr:transketolase [Thermoplasmata archaeon]
MVEEAAASTSPELDLLCIDTLRFLSVDMVEKAKSGHPGLPLGAAPMAYVLWTRFLRHHPQRPDWPDRDRFVLSAGHGSALLYALLHTTGYDLPMSELQRFRQWGSKTPGHPEVGHTPGVEVTTGPLGQGFAMGVGLAIAERLLATRFNRPGAEIVDHRTYAIVSDGDLMEGIASEAASLAGRVGLGKLVYLYDDNHVSLEGGTNLAFTEDVLERFRAYGWFVQRVEDGNDLDAIDAALRAALAQAERPSLISVRTHLGYGSPVQDTREAHGEPLGPAGTEATKKKLGWPLTPTFLVPEAAGARLALAVPRGEAWVREWSGRREALRAADPKLADAFDAAVRGTLPPGWDAGLPSFAAKDGAVATRDASSKLLNLLASRIPALVGGSADLNPSTKTYLNGLGDFGVDGGTGRNLHFGVREHAMTSIVNGLAMHGGLLPFSATFFCFADYSRPGLRIGALMHARALHIFTHDSVGLGEDGPTHQPVEHLWSLRVMPGMTVIRPGDANETVGAYRLALGRAGPVALVLTRQKLPTLDVPAERVVEGVQRGGYVLVESPRSPAEVILVATGSELSLAVRAATALSELSIATRVVSMPSTTVFDEQPAAYRHQVLPPGLPALAIEAGATAGWWKYVGSSGDVLGLDRFGASAPGEVVLAELGFTVEKVVERARRLVRPRSS